jgi:hypothetical protein
VDAAAEARRDIVGIGKEEANRQAEAKNRIWVTNEAEMTRTLSEMGDVERDYRTIDKFAGRLPIIGNLVAFIAKCLDPRAKYPDQAVRDYETLVRGTAEGMVFEGIFEGHEILEYFVEANWDFWKE